MFDSTKKNKQKTAFIVIGFTIFIGVIVYALVYLFSEGSMFAFTFAVIAAVLSSIGAYYNCDKIVLSMSNARPATLDQNKRMIENLEGLCIAADLPMPKLYIVEDSAPNAFATGRDPDHAVICVTTGLLDKLNDYELEGVLAHELSHIKNFDIRLQTVMTVMVGFVTILADIFLRIGLRRSRRSSNNNSSSGVEAILMIIGVIFLIISPIVAELIKLMLSRNREYLADSTAVELTRNPEGLINALLKISEDQEPLEVANKSTANLYICNPFKGKDAQVFLNKLFATHPPIEDRINALRNIH